MLYNRSILSFKYMEGGLKSNLLIQHRNITQIGLRLNSPRESGRGAISETAYNCFFFNYDVEHIENINFYFMSFFFTFQDRNAAPTAVGADLCALSLTKFLNRSNVRNLSEVSKLVFFQLNNSKGLDKLLFILDIKSSVFRCMLNFQR